VVLVVLRLPPTYSPPLAAHEANEADRLQAEAEAEIARLVEEMAEKQRQYAEWLEKERLEQVRANASVDNKMPQSDGITH
jgi:hypothetical protein